MYFLRKVIFTGLIFISWELNAQVALPTFQGVQAASEVALYSFSSHTFTNSSATGNTGPTLANCKSSYNTSWENDTDLFNVQTQGIQEWTVPASGTYRITAKGASGGIYAGSSSIKGFPGAGATVVGDISLTIGTVIKIVVGQKPTTTSNSSGNGSPGGGSSWVYTGSIAGNGLIVVAGGGGGTGHGSSSSVAGNGKGGNDANTSNESSNGENFGENARKGRGSEGNLGNGYGGKATVGGNYNGSGGGAGWLGDGQDESGGANGGDRFIGGTSPDGAHQYGGFGGGGGSGGNGNAGGGGGGYTGGGAGKTYSAVSGGGGSSWGGGGGGGSYASSSMSSVTMTEGDSGIDEADVDNGSIIIAKQ